MDPRQVSVECSGWFCGAESAVRTDTLSIRSSHSPKAKLTSALPQHTRVKYLDLSEYDFGSSSCLSADDRLDELVRWERIR